MFFLLEKTLILCCQRLLSKGSDLSFHSLLLFFDCCSLLAVVLDFRINDLLFLYGPSDLSFKHLLLMWIWSPASILLSSLDVSYLWSCIFGLAFEVIKPFFSIIWFPIKHSKPSSSKLSSMLGMSNPCVSNLSLHLSMLDCLYCSFFTFIDQLLLIFVPLNELAILFILKKIVLHILVLMPHIKDLLIIIPQNHFCCWTLMSRTLVVLLMMIH